MRTKKYNNIMASLYIVATPIGNLEDITIRAISTLYSSDVILCEDTRRTGQLLKYYENKLKAKEWVLENIKTDKYPQLVSFYDEVENIKADEIIDIIESGKKVALVSDSGTPLISDPGFKLIKKCIQNNIEIDSIPGPSAVITALTLSALPANNFMFLGFLPVKENARKKIITEIKENFNNNKSRPTIICYESPYRINKLLNNIFEIFGNIEIVIARELTKIHQEIIRGKIKDVIAKKINFKGEITVLFGTNS